MMSMILMLTFLFIFMRFHGWHLTAELPLGERAPWHPPCLESHRGFEWVAVPWDAKSVIFMLGAPFQWQTICSFFGAKQTLQIQGCTALTTVLLVLLFGWGVLVAAQPFSWCGCDPSKYPRKHRRQFPRLCLEILWWIGYMAPPPALVLYGGNVKTNEGSTMANTKGAWKKHPTIDELLSYLYGGYSEAEGVSIFPAALESPRISRSLVWRISSAVVFNILRSEMAVKSQGKSRNWQPSECGIALSKVFFKEMLGILQQ